MNESTPLIQINGIVQYSALPPDVAGNQSALLELGIEDESSCQASIDEDDERKEENNTIFLPVDGHEDSHNENGVDVEFDFYMEAKKLLHISLPTVGSQFCTFLIFPQTASIIGRHLDSESLAAFSLGSLTGNLTCTSIVIGTLTASETLQPRAFALGQYREVGLLAVRGFVTCVLTLILPMILLLTKVNDALDALGEDEVASEMASRWIRIYLWGVPSVILFRTTQRYLACQNIVLPCLLGAAVGCFFFHPFILKWAVDHYGFMGSAAALSVTQLVQALASLVFIVGMKSSSSYGYEPKTWPGINISFITDALRWDEIKTYAKLSIGGVFALSEWWFWESMCVMAGMFGMEALCVHTIAYQVLPITFMIPLGTSIGLSVRMGAILPFSVYKAKKLAMYTIMFITVVMSIVSGIVHIFRDEIVSTFSTDEAVVEGCHRIWINVCIHNVLLGTFAIHCAILRALGLQWRMATTIIGVLWFGALPSIYYLTIYEGGGFFLMWKMVPWWYMALNIALVIAYTTVSWQDIANDINKKRARGLSDL